MSGADRPNPFPSPTRTAILGRVALHTDHEFGLWPFLIGRIVRLYSFPPKTIRDSPCRRMAGRAVARSYGSFQRLRRRGDIRLSALRAVDRGFSREVRSGRCARKGNCRPAGAGRGDRRTRARPTTATGDGPGSGWPTSALPLRLVQPARDRASRTASSERATTAVPSSAVMIGR
jgi:hypothetical protein